MMIKDKVSYIRKHPEMSGEKLAKALNETSFYVRTVRNFHVEKPDAKCKDKKAQRGRKLINYTYRCKECGHKFTHKQPMGTSDLGVCPECKQKSLTRYLIGEVSQCLTK